MGEQQDRDACPPLDSAGFMPERGRHGKSAQHRDAGCETDRRAWYLRRMRSRPRRWHAAALLALSGGLFASMTRCAPDEISVVVTEAAFDNLLSTCASPKKDKCPDGPVSLGDFYRPDGRAGLLIGPLSLRVFVISRDSPKDNVKGVCRSILADGESREVSAALFNEAVSESIGADGLTFVDFEATDEANILLGVFANADCDARRAAVCAKFGPGASSDTLDIDCGGCAGRDDADCRALDDGDCFVSSCIAAITDL